MRDLIIITASNFIDCFKSVKSIFEGRNIEVQSGRLDLGSNTYSFEKAITNHDLAFDFIMKSISVNIDGDASIDVYSNTGRFSIKKDYCLYIDHERNVIYIIYEYPNKDDLMFLNLETGDLCKHRGFGVAHVLKCQIIENNE